MKIFAPLEFYFENFEPWFQAVSSEIKDKISTVDVLFNVLEYLKVSYFFSENFWRNLSVSQYVSQQSLNYIIIENS